MVVVGLADGCALTIGLTFRIDDEVDRVVGHRIDIWFRIGSVVVHFVNAVVLVVSVEQVDDVLEF